MFYQIKKSLGIFAIYILKKYTANYSSKTPTMLNIDISEFRMTCHAFVYKSPSIYHC